MVMFSEYAGRNPITVWWRVARWTVTEVSTKVTILLRVLSVLLLLVVLNAGALVLSRVANWFAWICRLPLTFWNMSVPALFRRCCRFVPQMFVDEGGGAKKQNAKMDVLGVARGLTVVDASPVGMSSGVGAGAGLGVVGSPVAGPSTIGTTQVVGSVVGQDMIPQAEL